jgi:hypothetical protein
MEVWRLSKPSWELYQTIEPPSSEALRRVIEYGLAMIAVSEMVISFGELSTSTLSYPKDGKRMSESDGFKLSMMVFR